MSILQTIKLEPQWSAASTPLRKSWCEFGNIDQFRWLSRADVQRHLAMARDEIGVRHVRAAAMYGPEMRVWGRPLPLWNKPEGKTHREANWLLVDLTIEQLLDLGIKPMYTTCFTPAGFSDSKRTCWPDGNSIGMPRDLKQWADFVESGLRHHVARFGREEMRTWYFECWNEPNLSGFFDGSKEDFFRLWSATWKAVKSVDSEFRFGGPSTARGEWIPEFLDWTSADGTLPDYIISHVYNNDSESAPLSPFDGPASHRVKDSPHFASGVIRGLRAELDSRDFQGEVHWNEWGRSWFPHDPLREGGLEAAFIVKTMAEVSQEADQFAFWCLSDIYDQIGFQSSEFQGHYGLLSPHGLRKPGWFAHTLLNRLGTSRLPVTGGNGLCDAIATSEPNGTRSMIIYSYPDRIDPKEQGTDLHVQVPLSSSAVETTAIRVDHQVNNIVTSWKNLGLHINAPRDQMEELRQQNYPHPDSAVHVIDGVLHATMQTPGILYLKWNQT